MNLRPDVDLVGNQHRPAATQSLSHGDSEVFLVRWQHESFAGVKRSPLGIADDQTGPVHSAGQVRGFDTRFQTGPHAGIRPRHHQIDIGRICGNRKKRIDQQVASFFRMDPTQVKKKTSSPSRGTGFIESFDLLLRLSGRRFRAVRHHRRIPRWHIETLRRQTLLRIAGEKNGAGIPQHASLRQVPVNPLLDVLQRITPLEPRIEHSMGKQHIRFASVDRAPRAKTLVLPDAMNHDAVEAIDICTQPGNPCAGIAIGALALA